jgi:hypothetical protein
MKFIFDKIIILEGAFILIPVQYFDSSIGLQNLLGRVSVTVSLPETQNACGENVRLCDSPRITMRPSEKQEPNINQGP